MAISKVFTGFGRMPPARFAKPQIRQIRPRSEPSAPGVHLSSQKVTKDDYRTSIKSDCHPGGEPAYLVYRGICRIFATRCFCYGTRRRVGWRNGAKLWSLGLGSYGPGGALRLCNRLVESLGELRLDRYIRVYLRRIIQLVDLAGARYPDSCSRQRFASPHRITAFLCYPQVRNPVVDAF